MGIKESAREIAKKITDGRIEPTHLGKYSTEMIDQEIFSLENQKPMFRGSKWKKSYENLKDAIMKKISKNEDFFVCQMQLRILEGVRNQR